MASWLQQINKHTVVLPAEVASLENGKFPASVLHDVFNGRGTRIGKLHKQAARSWAAMTAAAAQAGVILDATDTYRTYETQVRIFRERYQTTPIKYSAKAGYKTKKWQGQTWYQKPGTATAAAPGTSNHGKASAVDDKNKTDSTGLGWLEAHAGSYGWEWELASEVWHLHYWPGDDMPQAVLDFENNKPTEPETPEDEDVMELVTVIPGRENELPKEIQGGAWWFITAAERAWCPSDGNARAAFQMGLTKRATPIEVSPTYILEKRPMSSVDANFLLAKVTEKGKFPPESFPS